MSFGEIFIPISFVIGLITAAVYAYRVLSIKIDGRFPHSDVRLLQADDGAAVGGHTEAVPVDRLIFISSTIERGAKAFLFAEYKYIGLFLVLFMILVGFLAHWPAAFAFIWGGVTSLLCGYLGMMIAVKANVRVAHEAVRGWGPAFNTAFEGGAVMGFALTSIGLMNLFILVFIMRRLYNVDDIEDMQSMWEAIAGYGLGGSTMALFGRVGGGIYTKAADVGADLVGKVEAGIPEDDPRNPAVIADNVGDNVGDIAGMGSDLFGSFGESTCAALVVAGAAHITGDATGTQYLGNTDAQWFPLAVTALGILVCLVTSVIPQIWRVKGADDVERQLKVQLIVSTVINTPLLYLLAAHMLPENFIVNDVASTPVKIFGCIAAGLWAGLIIGLTTEYFTSHSYQPVREVADSCNTGHATNIIFGLALGFKSVIIPVVLLAVVTWASSKLGAQYGVAMAALGMLSTLAIGLTIDAYGPISDNAGGIAEMCEMGEHIREKTDALDAAGNTTAAVGKGFAIGSAALVSLALFGAFTDRATALDANSKPIPFTVDIKEPMVFAGLLVGVMLPYWFSALTMKSVGIAAQAMVKEVRRQFREIPGIMEGTAQPEYEKCVAISTQASLLQMIPPGALVICSPILIGFLFGKHCLAGLLIGGMTSGVQIAISMSNTGGAWDNAKKYIEKGNHGGKGSAAHSAAVTGDTVGDPMKDTSGPSVNILMKLMAIISLVFASSIRDHGGVFLRLGGIDQIDT